MTKASNKADRLGKIEAILLAHPEGLKPAEIARKLDVHRSTIARNLPDLPNHIYIDDFDDGRWKIDRSNYLVNVRLSLHEAMSVHLAARLLATRMNKKNPHAAAALRKLGASLERLAPKISQHLQQSADVMDDETQRYDPAYLEMLETLTLAWAEQRKVHLWHRHESGKIYEYDFAPYFIEPYAVGQTTHVIGYREPPKAIRTLKLERIERIELRRDTYAIPPDFNPSEKLADAWGIWFTDSEPVEVVLKFHRDIAHRVRETQWHRSEQPLDEQPDSSSIWRATIAEPTEMVPWIRGWGANVEVLAPEGLRQTLQAEARRLATIYKVNEQEDESGEKHQFFKDFFGG